MEKKNGDFFFKIFVGVGGIYLRFLPILIWKS